MCSWQWGIVTVSSLPMHVVEYNYPSSSEISHISSILCAPSYQIKQCHSLDNAG